MFKIVVTTVVDISYALSLSLSLSRSNPLFVVSSSYCVCVGGGCLVLCQINILFFFRSQQFRVISFRLRFLRFVSFRLLLLSPFILLFILLTYFIIPSLNGLKLNDIQTIYIYVCVCV